MRVVSLNCSNTEIVCALGCGDLLVGVDNDSDYPPAVVEALPRVGRDLEIDVDEVRALEPDLVIASLTVPGHEQVIARLDAAGLDYLAPEPVSLDDVYRDIDTIAAALNVPERVAGVIGEMRRAIVPHDVERRPRILVQWWPKPVIAPGRMSWVNDLIHCAGGSNPLGEREVKSTPLEDDEVAALDPDAIVIAWCGVPADKYRPEVVYRNPAFKAVTAVTNRRVFNVSEAYLGRPSPRLIDGYRALRDIVDGS